MKMIAIVAGARPNFMKIAPIARALSGRNNGLLFKIVHTGQHYDREMNDVFFLELGIPKPDISLGAGSGSHAHQTARIMIGFEEFCQREAPDLVLVVGDVNSTLACSIVAKKQSIPVAHVEAGLRSGDMTMPEEINRIVTDSIADFFFVTEPSGVDNLVREGKVSDRVFHVGHVMVDNLLYQNKKLGDLDVTTLSSSTLKMQHPSYGVITLHRPSNVDDPATFSRVASALREVSCDLPLIFPVHPRTRANLQRFEIDLGPRVILTPPLSYMDFLYLWKDAVMVLTDSGGLQEETTALNVSCITIRENTERPITVTEGTNVIAGTDTRTIIQAAHNILSGNGKRGRRPKFWDGCASERIVEILERELISI